MTGIVVRQCDFGDVDADETDARPHHQHPIAAAEHIVTFVGTTAEAAMQRNFA